VPHGYNTLIFDFRAHGASGGQLTSFGDLERDDVLAAVGWIRANHANESKKIFGVGASMGAAALIAAAADRSADGQAIDAIAAYGSYDSIPAEMRFLSEDRLIPPLRWLIDRFALPMASVQVGSNLADFSPAALVQQLWPRPIMVIHGVNDPIISFERGRLLFESAEQPKTHLWIDGAGHNDLMKDQDVAQQVRRFFQDSAPVPII
jgi:hypothetical protein